MESLNLSLGLVLTPRLSSLLQLIVLWIALSSVHKPCTCNRISAVLDLSQKNYGHQIHEVDKRFLSFALDSISLYRHWRNVDLTNGRLITLTKYLRPAYLRVGGTAADAILFSPDKSILPKSCNQFQYQNDSQLQLQVSTHTNSFSTEEPCRGQHEVIDDTEFDATIGPPTKNIYGEDLERLKEFVEATDSALIYDLNVLLRKNGAWDPNNTRQLLRFMTSKKMKVSGWELGNEPNLFPQVFNVTLKPKQLARDFSRLGNVISEFPMYHKSFIVGPDSTNPDGFRSKPKKYLRRFLRNLQPNTIQRVSFHHYYFNGHTATLADYLNATIMDSLKTEIDIVQAVVQKHTPNTSVWIGETSIGWGGGTPGISNAFAGIFMWIDKLGIAASRKIDVVIKESLIHGPYGLLTKDADPTPNYFASFLFKSLVGRKVLQRPKLQNMSKMSNFQDEVDTDPLSGLRLYLHCGPSNKRGSVTLYGINVGSSWINIKIKGKGKNRILVYLLQAPDDNLTSEMVLLNGNELKIDASGRLPTLDPVETHGVIQFPPLSVGFWVFPNAKFAICL